METKETIKEILKNYHALETKRKVFAAAGKTSPEIEKFSFVKECIELLSDESKDIIECVFIQHMSIRGYAKRNYLSHTTVERRVNAAVQTIADCFI